jgi:hypothetical protein
MEFDECPDYVALKNIFTTMLFEDGNYKMYFDWEEKDFRIK